MLSGGGNAAHGFAALAEFDGNGDGVVDSRYAGRDTNGDGVVDGKDKNWGTLRVMRWTDSNNNGVRDSGEESLVSLAFLTFMDRIRGGKFKCRKGLTFPVFVLSSSPL